MKKAKFHEKMFNKLPTNLLFDIFLTMFHVGLLYISQIKMLDFFGSKLAEPAIAIFENTFFEDWWIS